MTFLLDHGANPNASVDLHGTVLAAAAKGGRLDVVRLLLERGARPDGAALRAAAQGGMPVSSPFCSTRGRLSTPVSSAAKPR
ncbi:MAG: hypothetical protein MPW14_09160 [Candidatus Manganitrophus sp.]|nr:MAG: hypothetical protein MPW17_19300 [Candidatus Manganitrophus sp.]WDT81862.1 MAG: hypothetical protein MPW14_09160 [Candidatus Manganitrophus sp.]